MALSITPGRTFTPNEQVTNTKLADLVEDAVITGIARSNLGTNFFGVTASGSQPSALGTGELWFDTALKQLMVNDGSQVVAVNQRVDVELTWRALAGYATLIPGDIAVVSGSADVSCTATTATFTRSVAGVCMATVTDGQAARLCISGVVTVNFTGAGSRGEYAYVSSATAKSQASGTLTIGAYGILVTNVASSMARVLVGGVPLNV